MPKGWTGTVDFDGPGTLRLNSTGIALIASEAWLVEFHDEYVQRQKATSLEHCDFELSNYTFTVYRIENEPIIMLYQIARTEKDQDGWTWFFKILIGSTLPENMMPELRSIVAQVVEISDPNNN